MPDAATNSSAVPSPPIAKDSLWWTSNSISNELMPTTIRCAARPDRVPATVGRCATVRAPCSQPVITA